MIELYRKRYRSVEWTSQWRLAFVGRALKVTKGILRMAVKQVLKNRTQL
ncbi:hypothetical protein HanXRQr2_Chr08g0332581 [Helianthus annuus]|uniref:Uncharacterized protein n=1 Tax=Helianthus annuus TaxID=4232 RepID=A0A9K3IDN3_HELAN|nr:hypothetical protein HanXRQr2_Chr08g0332581 [Helianthus annuus]